MKLNDYVIATNGCMGNRLCSVKAKNSKQAVVKTIAKLYNELYEDDEEVYPVDGNLLYEKFIENHQNLVDVNLDYFISHFIFSEFEDCGIVAVMENGIEIYNTED